MSSPAAMAAHTTHLGRTEVVVPRLGVGTAAWGKNKYINLFGSTERPEDEEAAFKASVERGVFLFDTAAQYKYGNSEVRLGELARGTDAVIATKWSPSPLALRSRSLLVSLDASLARLGRSSVDLYQVHMPVPFVPVREMMARMAEAVVSGKIRAVGVSNFSEAQMREAHAALAERGIPLATNQIHYSLLYRRPEFDGVLDACRELGVTPIAFMPLAMGLLSAKYRPGDVPRDWVRRRLTGVFRPTEIAAAGEVTARLEAIGGRYGKTPAQVALRWVIDQGVIPIPGAKDAQQARQNAGALTFSLTRDEIRELSDSAAAWIQKPKWKFGPALGNR